MAITKQQANGLTEADKAAADALEKRIDAWLLERSHSSVGFDINGISPKVRAEIESRYRAAGWTVTYNSDQRDGDFWSFK